MYYCLQGQKFALLERRRSFDEIDTKFVIAFKRTWKRGQTVPLARNARVDKCGYVNRHSDFFLEE